MKTRNRITLSVIGIVAILLITIGLSYAYFSANLTGGEEATTITVTGGTMNIVYDGGANINVANIIPSASPVATKIFTVTGNNTTDIDMGYKISIVIDSNTFSEEALKYKLISINTDNNGTVVPSINELTNIGTGPKTIELGNGTFEVPTGGNKVHTYNLEIHFPNANYNQNEDQGKEFKAYIKTESINYLEYDAEKGVNKPQLATGMVPIKWDGNNWVSTTSNDPDWYDYNNKKWANIATIDQSKAIDYSGNNYYGEIIGAVQTENGLSFDGIDDYVLAPDNLDNYDFGNTITIGAEFIKKPNSDWNSIISNTEGAGFGLDIGITNKIDFLLHIGGEYKRITSNTTLIDNEKYKVVGTYDGNLMKLYINGSLDGTFNVSGSIKTSPLSVMIGANPAPNRTGSFYSQSIVSQAFIYTEAVPENQIENIFENNYVENLFLYYDFRKTSIEANTILSDANLSTMWVWIPRYAYRITSEYHSNVTGTIDIKFLKGRTNQTVDNTVIETSGYEVGVKDTSMHHFLHPAFQFNGEELGFWVAKFEPTAAEGVDTIIGTCNASDNVTTKTVRIIPNALSWRCITVGNAFDVSINMKDNKVYGWNSNKVDTHLMKNTEWGVVAYLSKSLYGADEEVWNNAYNQFRTGCSGTEVDALNESVCVEYNTTNGVKASTTHNIYGIYDMSGGAWERVAGYANNEHENLTVNAHNLISSNNKYKNIYSIDENDTRETNYKMNKNIYGDAIYETSNTGDSTLNSWFQDYSNMPYNSNPLIERGGRYSYSNNAGVFAYATSAGQNHVGISFRPVLFVVDQ